MVLLCAITTSARAQLPAATDTLVARLVGDWQGTGKFDGNTLHLTRSWTLVLRGQFVRIDQHVDMPNGNSFSAVMYWKPRGERGSSK